MGDADAERGTHQSVGAGSCAAGGDGRATRSRANASAESSDAAAGRVLHDTGVDAENVGARFCTQHIGGSDVQVVSGNFDIEVVFEREGNGVVDREIDFAIMHERIDA